jgi:acetone carboxylase gamma subunit
MFSESMRLEPGWAAEFRGAWDLPEDFDFDVVTPTVGLARAEPGKVTPEDSVARFLAQATAYRSEEPEVPVATEMTKQLLADLLDEKLSRAAVKEIQSSMKDPDRFDIWVELLQERVPYDDPIVLPFGEGLNIVRRRSDGELVIRSDAGHDFCRWDENWKMHALVFVRDTDELYQEIYPRLSHPEGAWMELREYYCPISGRLLDTEAVPPGYPVAHEYLPDITGFYAGWLGREVPT